MGKDVMAEELAVLADMAQNSRKFGTPFNFIHLESMIKIDLIPQKKSTYRIHEFERRIQKPITRLPRFGWLNPKV